MKIGRNEPCPCGSGKKYKKCHLGVIENTLSKSDLKLLEDKFKNFKLCMVPQKMKKDCSKRIINAHTISKSRNLKAIAENGHVLTFKINSVFKLLKNKGEIKIEKIGINNASIFKGFCSYHDKELFSCIEDENIIFSPKQIFMTAYRSICNELYIKNADLNQKKFLLNSMRNKITLNYVKRLEVYIKGIELAIDDLNKVKKIYDQIILEDKGYDKVNYYILEINKIPDVLVSGNWIPDKNFDGEKLINLADTKVNFNSLNVSSIVTDKGGAFIFAWIDSEELVTKNIYNFIKSFMKLDNKLKINILPRFIFGHFENVYFNPTWWNSLTQQQKELIEKDVSFIYTYGNSTYLSYKHLNKNYSDIFKFDILNIITNLSI